MSLPTQYDFQSLQKKWHSYWQSQGIFTASLSHDKEPYTMVMPPPNVTGILHLGHVLNNTIQDVLVRKARMQGKQTSWIPGLDHAAIATEAKVVEMLKAKGINKDDLSREEFIQYALQWKEKYGSIIFDQLKELGLSCDWTRTHFTLEPSLQQAVQKAFITLYEKGYVYRSKRMIHWDPKGQTALADEEVIYQEVQGHLYYIRYDLVGEDESVIVATTRPETLLGDTAVCVHPEDKRYKHLQGKKVYVPLIERPIPILSDAYVDREMGTGCLKITPAHDPNDYDIAQRHGLPMIDMLNPDGTLNAKAGLYVGEDRAIARKKVVKALEKQGYLVKVTSHTHQVGFSERTQAIVEPKLSTQWFIKMKNLATPALEAVQKETIHFYPNKFQNLYTHWMENIKDWCISRQLWWGHRIPAYYLKDGRFVIAHNLEEALTKARVLTGNKALTKDALTQDEDVLDTWFSAWLWPIAVFHGIQKPNNPTFSYRYPTDDLVTAPDIIFFWVARMIMAGYAFTNKPPFKNVYFTGLVRDEKGHKMSKSLGNSPDPIDLIKKYSADGVRAGMLFCAPAGNDLLFEEKLCSQGARFVHKIWNALRLVKSWKTTNQAPEPIIQHATTWFEARYQQILKQVNNHFDQFRISEALILIYRLIWNDFCAHYLEMVKPLQSKCTAGQTYKATAVFFEQLMKLLHPFMPFITEEAWHQLHPRKEKNTIALASWPRQKSFNQNCLDQAQHAFALINQIRHIKSQHKHSKDPLVLYIKDKKPTWLTHFESYIKKSTGISKLHEAKIEKGTAFVVAKSTFYLPQMNQANTQTDGASLMKELEYAKGLLAKIESKLSNDRFLQHAPSQVVTHEKKKRTDAQEKIKALQNLLASG